MTGIEIRAQSTKDNAAGTSKCKLQPITLSYTATTYAVTSSAADASLLSATQCQNAPLTYTATVTGEASLPAWVQNTPSTPILNIRPSQVRSSTYIKTNTVSVTASDKTAVPQTTTASMAVTFTNSVPTVASTLSNQVMYKGMGANTISIASISFTDDDSISMSVSNNLSGVTPTTFSLSGNTLSIKMPNSYTGSFSTTVTDTDYVGQTVSTAFTITVNNWTQTFWDYCTGTVSTQCTKWLDCYTFVSGVCSYDKTTWANYTAPTYLTREVEATSPEGIGASVAAATAASVGASAVTGVSPVVAGLGISQCQSIQALSMFNMNTPDNYVSYSQGYEVTKLNFKFINGIGLQNSLSKSTRRNLNTGYKSLTNIGFGYGNFFVNYIYFFLFLLIMILLNFNIEIPSINTFQLDLK